MTLSLVELAENLVLKDPELDRFRDEIIRSFGNPVAIQGILTRQCRTLGTLKCLPCKNEGECSVIHGIAYLDLGGTRDAIKNLEDAVRHFTWQGETWNGIISLVLLGIACGRFGDVHQSLHHTQDALRKLEQDYLRVHSNDYPKKALKLKEELQIYITNPPFVRPKKRVHKQARLIFSSLPVFTGVKASPNGPIWENLPKGPKIIVEQIILDDQVHTLHPVSIGNQITLSDGKKYGCVKVSGDSMSAAKPVDILDGDYVLFYESQDAPNGAIVIAAVPDKAGSGYEFVVKRLSRPDGLLISETEPLNKYPHMPLGRNVAIKGTVIAVAKPA